MMQGPHPYDSRLRTSLIHSRYSYPLWKIKCHHSLLLKLKKFPPSPQAEL